MMSFLKICWVGDLGFGLGLLLYFESDKITYGSNGNERGVLELVEFEFDVEVRGAVA